jgi:Repeat of unknown function (DUF5648)
VLRYMTTTPWRQLLVAGVATVLAGCGGADDPAVASAKLAPPSAVASWATAARLNTDELQAAEERASRGTEARAPIAGETKAAALLPVYRFYNSQTGAHFYTTSTAERDTVLATLPQFGYEGQAFSAHGSADAGLSPVHRFFNAATGVHFYTISASEKAYVDSQLPSFRYEGVAYHASQVAGAGLSPLYRFYVTSKGFHFYTASGSEAATIRATLPQYRYEGVGYHVAGAPVDPPPGATACDNAPGRVLLVGPGKTYSVPSAAAAVAQAGDVVRIDAGDYRGDVATWSASNLSICGVGGRARLFADGRSAQGKAIWVVSGADTVIDSVEFHDAKVADLNGAGIRAEHQRGGLRVINSGFYDNENGILSSAGPITISIERSEFARNCTGRTDGQTHNIYIGAINQLTVTSSYFHETRYGHNLKSRARVSVVENSYLMDGPTGPSSYLADFSNGGQVFLRGNLFHKGPAAPNRVAIAYGAEGLAAGGTHTLEMVHNTVVMTRPNSSFLRAPAGTQSVRLTANLLASTANDELITAGGFPVGSIVQQGNVRAPATGVPGADHIAAPNFWPDASVQALIALGGVVDAGYTRDAPQPMTARNLSGTSRVAGALQSAP